MAVDGIGFAGKVITARADADLSSLQYHLVKLTATGVAACGANEHVIGVLLNAPALGVQASIGVLGIFPVFVDATTAIAKGDGIDSDASSHGVKNATDKAFIVGYALEAKASGTGTINVLVLPQTQSV